MTGMAEYIEKEKILDAVNGCGIAAIAVYHRIKNLPAANVRENVKGEWMKFRNDYNGTLKTDEWYGPIFVCSVCGEEMLGTPNYCPNCGAEMRGGNDGE